MTPATVPDAYPPRAFVTSHSRVTSASGFSGSTTGHGMRRSGSAMSPLSGGSPANRRFYFGPRPQRRKNKSALAENPPAAVLPQRRRSAAAVFRLLARPSDLPRTAGGRREQGFGNRRPVEIRPEVDDEQAVVGVIAGEEAQGKRGRTEDGAVHRAGTLDLEGVVFVAHLEQVAMQRVCLGVRLALGEIELAAGERVRRSGVVESGAFLERGGARELRQKLGAAAADRIGELRLEVREVQKRRRGGKLLALEQHRR